MNYVVIAEFKVKEGMAEQFQELMTKHAYRSVTLEEGCFQFEVVRRTDEENHFVLFERYLNEEAYKAHRADPRHPEVIAKITPLVVQRDGNVFWNRWVATGVSFRI